MQIVIDIDESLLDGIKSDNFDFARQVVKNFQGTIASAIANGTPIPDNATNGDMIKALFPNTKIEHQGGIIRFIVDCWSFQIADDWWNALYQKGGK